MSALYETRGKKKPAGRLAFREEDGLLLRFGGRGGSRSSSSRSSGARSSSGSGASSRSGSRSSSLSGLRSFDNRCRGGGLGFFLLAAGGEGYGDERSNEERLFHFVPFIDKE
jgi:hypothetical protein